MPGTVARGARKEKLLSLVRAPMITRVEWLLLLTAVSELIWSINIIMVKAIKPFLLDSKRDKGRERETEKRQITRKRQK